MRMFGFGSFNDLTVLFGTDEIPAWPYRGFGQIKR